MTLDQIAIMHGTDKSSLHHDYCRIYEKYFEPLRGKQITLLEAGFGGYEHFDRGGESIRMWETYFSMANIVTFDIHEKSMNLYHPKRTKFYHGSQVDKDFLSRISLVNGFYDIVIDDASHVNPLTIETFEILWPYVKSGGYYVIEDLETSYWNNKEFKGGEYIPTSTMNYFKRLTDSLNHGHSSMKDWDIDSIHFWRQIIFIVKK
jgi:hypothetical protein